MYYEKPDTTKNTPIVSIPFVVVRVIHVCTTFFVKSVTGLDEIGYSSTILNPIVYFTALLVVLGVVVGLKNKSLGFLDMILGFIILVATYFSLN